MNTYEILEKLARPGIYVCVWPRSVAFVETDADGVQHQLKPDTFERDGVLRRDRWNSGVGSSIHGPFQRAPAAGKWRKHVLTAGECPPQSNVVLAGALERLERSHGITQDGERDREAVRLADEASDAQRLDWLEHAGDVSIGMVIDAPHDGEFFVNADGHSAACGYGATVRAAIDAATKDAARIQSAEPETPR